MTIGRIITNLRVGGALYPQIAIPQYDQKMKRYMALVRRPDGTEQVCYSRFPTGPFVFHLPDSEFPHP